MAKSPRAPGAPFIFVTLLLDVLCMSLPIPVTPRLVASFVGGDLADAARWTGPLIALYTTAQFLAAPALGALSDRLGRKPVLLGALALTAVATALMAVAPGLGWIFAARALGGLAAGGMAVAAAYMADVSTDADRARNFGLVGAAWGLGFILGPVVGGTLAGLGLAAPFLAAAAVAALNLAYGLVAVPESLAPERRRPIARARLNPWSFVATLRQGPVVAGTAVAMVLVGLAQQCQQSTWVLMTAMKFHWSAAMTGASLALAGLGMAVVQGALLPRLAPRLGERRMIVGGLAWCAATLVLQGLAAEAWQFLAAVALASLSAVAGPAAQGLLARQVPADGQGALQGAITSVMSLTGIVGPLLANQLFARFAAGPAPLPGVAFLVGAGLAALAALQMARVLRRSEEVPAALAN